MLQSLLTIFLKRKFIESLLADFCRDIDACNVGGIDPVNIEIEIGGTL